MKKQKSKTTAAAKEARALASALPEANDASSSSSSSNGVHNDDGRIVVSANSVWNIKLVHTLAELESPESTFHPEFTHVFFDDDEEIEGFGTPAHACSQRLATP